MAVVSSAVSTTAMPLGVFVETAVPMCLPMAVPALGRVTSMFILLFGSKGVPDGEPPWCGAEGYGSASESSFVQGMLSQFTVLRLRS
ncbi:hypothetical protein ACWDR3_41270 [Streptomyces sp. NPDC001002]